MKECNSHAVSSMIMELFVKKLEEFEYLGEREWGNPSSSMVLPTYIIDGSKGKLYCAPVEFVKAGTDDANRQGIIATLPNSNPSVSLGQIIEVMIPYYFSRSFNTRAYQEKDVIEIRNYGRFTIGRGSLKKELFFNFIREKGLEQKIRYDEEQKPYITVLKLVNNDISKTEFADSLIDFTLLIKQLKDCYR